ncbi:hypothetical protein K2X83_01255 [Patescibacteria group bacterium]|nr:hypothetical protein [Patescibacteria group bacterium]
MGKEGSETFAQFKKDLPAMGVHVPHEQALKLWEDYSKYNRFLGAVKGVDHGDPSFLRHRVDTDGE